MAKLKNKKRRWFTKFRTTYVLIIVLFIVWMLFFDTNSFIIHKELNDDIKALEENKEFYQEEIMNDKAFIEKMKDSDEVEKFAREQYYLKRDNEEIFLIESEDSLKTRKEK